VAILSALLAPILLTSGEPRTLELRPELIVSVPAFMFVYETKSLVGTMLPGGYCFSGLSGK